LSPLQPRIPDFSFRRGQDLATNPPAAAKLSRVIGDILQPTHLLFVLVVALLVLGPKRLPEVGRSLGRGLRDFRSALSGDEHDQRDEVLTPAAGTPPVVSDPSPAEPVVAPVTPSQPVASEASQPAPEPAEYTG
jgi:sec-independent protein translocase protein TatA